MVKDMLSDKVVAEEVAKLVYAAKDTLLESMALVESKCSREEYAAYKRAVGQVVTKMLTEIVEPLYERNPALKPDGWDT
jgi:hypothetical protein